MVCVVTENTNPNIMRLTTRMIQGNRAQQLTHLRGQGWRVVAFKTCSLIVAFSTFGERFAAKAWTRKADKTDWYYTFSTMAKLEAYVAQYEKSVISREASKASRKAERSTERATLKASDHWTVGDVIYNSWGYDQTNIDFYQVVEVKAKSIVVREVAANSNDVGGPSGGKTAPRRGLFTGKPMLKPCDERGRISFRHGGASKWDGRALGCSSYH